MHFNLKSLPLVNVADANLNPIFGIAESIGDHVPNHLLQPHLIASHLVGQKLVPFDLKVSQLRLRLLSVTVDDFAHGFFENELLIVDSEL